MNKVNYDIAKTIDKTGELAYIGLRQMAKVYLSDIQDAYGYQGIAHDIVDTFLDTSNVYTLQYFKQYCNQIKIWDYSDFAKQFHTLSKFFTYDDLVDIVSTLFNIDCCWEYDDYGNACVICYEYEGIDKDEIDEINIIGTYMECERLMTLRAKEIISIDDVESAVICFNEYLNGYLLSAKIQDDNVYVYCDNVLDKINKLIGGVL